MISLGTADVAAASVGSTELVGISIGATEVWSAAPSTPAQPTVVSGDTTATITFVPVANATSYTVETEPT